MYTLKTRPSEGAYPVRTASVFASRRRCISLCTSLSCAWHLRVSAFSSETDNALFAIVDDDDSSVVEPSGGPVLPVRIDPSSPLDDVASIAAIRCCAVRSSRTCFALDAFVTSCSVASNRAASGAPAVLVKKGLAPPIRSIAKSEQIAQLHMDSGDYCVRIVCSWHEKSASC